MPTNDIIEKKKRIKRTLGTFNRLYNKISIRKNFDDDPPFPPVPRRYSRKLPSREIEFLSRCKAHNVCENEYDGQAITFKDFPFAFREGESGKRGRGAVKAIDAIPKGL